MDALITFLDVGQGDCTIAIDRARGEAILIDCPAGCSDEALKALRAEGARELSLVFVTHSDWDHIGGVFQAIMKIGAREVRFNLDSLLIENPATDSRIRATLRAFAGLED